MELRVKAKSGRTYYPHYNQIDCYGEDDDFLFAVRLPTEFEVEMVMQDLKENSKP